MGEGEFASPAAAVAAIPAAAALLGEGAGPARGLERSAFFQDLGHSKGAGEQRREGGGAHHSVSRRWLLLFVVVVGVAYARQAGTGCYVPDSECSG